MAERNPPAWLQAGSHPAENDRLLIGSLVPQEGAVSGADLLVSQNGTPNMTVNVAAGGAFVKNDLATYGGTYHVFNDGTKNVAISASDPTNPRNDLVTARVRDSAYTGGSDAWDLFVITGTPAGSPSDPAIPADGSYLVLARVRVAAGASTITDANITDLRPRASVPANVATPIGAITEYAGSVAPAGWLLCDGAAVSRTTYAALFAVIGTTFGAGDGSSTFNVPDTRSRTVVGAGQGSGLTNRALAATGGVETHALAVGEVPSHNHSGSTAGNENGHTHTDGSYATATSGAHSHTPGGTFNNWIIERGQVEAQRIPDAGETSGGVYVTFTASVPNNGSTHSHDVTGSSGAGSSHSHTVTVASQGGGAAHQNMPPFVALNRIIRAF